MKHDFLTFSIAKSKTLCLLLATVLLLSTKATAQTGHFFPANWFSSSLISEMCQDKYGNVWIGTDYGLNRFDGYRFTTYLHSDADSLSLCDNAVVSLLCDREGRLWVGTNRGLDCYDATTDAFVHYPLSSTVSPRISEIAQLSDGTLFVGTAGYGAYSIGAEGQVQKISEDSQAAHLTFYSLVYEDTKKRLWKCGYDNTVIMQSGQKTRRFVSPGMPVGIVERDGEVFIVGLHGIMTYSNQEKPQQDIDMSIVENKDVLFSAVDIDRHGNIIIGSRGRGLFRIPAGKRQLERISVSAFGIDPGTAKVWDIMFDRKGNLWLGLQHKGLLVIPQRPMQFRNWSFENQNIRLGSSITSVCEGDNGVVWCSVQGVGIYGFDKQGQIVGHPAAPPAVEFIFRTPNGQFWIGTDDGLFSYDPLTGRYQQKVTFDCDKFNDMTTDKEGNIYISTFSRGFCIYNPLTGSLQNYRLDRRDEKKGFLCNDWVMCLMPDHDGLIWMGTSSGVSCFDPKTKSFRSQGWHQLLNGYMCFALCEQRNGNIVIGTEKGLFLYDRQSKQTTPFPGAEALSDKVVSYIVQSNDGDLWCSTSMGIWQYNAAKKSFTGHIAGNGLITKEYLYGVGLHTDDDRIFFGNNDGITTFNPSKMKSIKTETDTLHLTAFSVAGTPVSARTVLNGVQVTTMAVPETETFDLSYRDNTFTMSFSLLNYSNWFSTSYEYRVNGGRWTPTPKGDNSVTLSHMQPGVYNIEARAVTGDSYSTVKRFRVVVHAPWYRTTTAYAVYLLLLLALGAFIFYVYRRRAAEQMNEEKMKFLMNATHDIRSPLTLIVNPLDKIKRIVKSQSDPTVATDNQAELMRSIDVIERNTQSILNLVNQILDVRKIDKQQMQLHCTETELVGFTRGICKMFEYSAESEGIQFLLLPDAEQITAWIDRSQFEKVIMNLLSNAFKYCSKEGGTVEVRLSATEKTVQLQVRDNGIGLDSSTLKHVFDRFYQGSNSRHLHIEGTGIGLNLCKMIVDMHHGTIEAANRTDTHGCVFTVSLPAGHAHLTEAEMEQPAAEETPRRVALKSTGKRCRVLIVDDDKDIAQYISSELSQHYDFGICYNGKEGLNELLERARAGSGYDVVVSDVMMPEMDGFTMLRMLKSNLNISHIPVIMLTSKSDVGNRLEGLERGADAFLAKPFNMEELHLTIENLARSRQRLKGKFTGAQQQADKLVQPQVKGNDELLMERIMKSVNKNLGNSNFNVDMLMQDVGISRAQLHRKMKEMTGLSTSEFIRNIRLEQAARLLREQKINITQVAYTVGFSNLAHFSTIFRKHFGVSPSEYIEHEKE